MISKHSARPATTISAFEFMNKFPDDAAREHLEGLRWGRSVDCPCCGSINESTPDKSRPGYRRCRECRQYFTVRTGTVFERSHIGLRKWLYAIYLLETSKKGISSLQLSKEIGITQKSAWFLLQRLREACDVKAIKLRGFVEIDGTYIGGKQRNHHDSKPHHSTGGPGKQAVVLGMRARKQRPLPICGRETPDLHNPDRIGAMENTTAQDFDGTLSALLRAPTTSTHNGNGLDQFYTKPRIARKCWSAVQRVIGRLPLLERNYHYIEPAAGCGCFYQVLPRQRRTGIDLEPRNLPRINGRGIIKGIIKDDYLKWSPKPTARTPKYVVIGNPPFGKRGKLAVDFFNHSGFAEIITFIVPVSFRKFTIQRRLLLGYALVARTALSNDSFCTPDGKDYSVNAEFQVWVRTPCKLKDMREHMSAAISHADFEMRQYNNTEKALVAFDEPFDFAVPCQGYQDYSRRETDPENCERHKQWMLFTGRNKGVRARLKNIDFATLAYECATATPGFRKNDVVKYYDSLV